MASAKQISSENSSKKKIKRSAEIFYENQDFLEQIDRYAEKDFEPAEILYEDVENFEVLEDFQEKILTMDFDDDLADEMRKNYLSPEDYLDKKVKKTSKQPILIKEGKGMFTIVNLDNTKKEEKPSSKVAAPLEISRPKAELEPAFAPGAGVSPESEEASKGPALEVYGTDLTKLASERKIEDCFGREEELNQMMEILVRRQKNNPVLVGNAGVGKTAIIELFANKIVKHLVPFVLEGRRLVSIDLTRMLAGARYRGEFELRLQRLLDEVLEKPNVIIFIDEIHNLGGTGASEGSLDAANILKPVLSRSGFQCIGATTIKEYEKIEKDPALNRRFQPILVKEPSIEDTVKILTGIRPSLESFHNVEFLPSALKLAAELSSRYIYDRFLPDKAIDLIDRAAARKVIELTRVSDRSLVSEVVNAALIKIGRLKFEAFRKGDIASQFVFQEVENAYRNFLLRWLEKPAEKPKKLEKALVLSRISSQALKVLRIEILKHIETALFSPTKPNESRKVLATRISNLSPHKNAQIAKLLFDEVADKQKLVLSSYRISLLLFIISYVSGDKKLKGLIALKEQGVYEFIHGRIKSTLKLSVPLEPDFSKEDTEVFYEASESLSKLNKSRLNVFKRFIGSLKPLIAREDFDNLVMSSKLELNQSELVSICAILGYASTEQGKTFLTNTDDPDEIKRAREIKDFASLKAKITDSEIQELLSEMTGIPVQSVTEDESQKLVGLETTLHKRVIGQEEAIGAISKAIRRSRLGIQNPNRPIASFFFCGPTGVGKTEVTKALASVMFGSEQDMIRFDMSEFMEKFAISRLIGSPPGYVGYEEGGQLTNAVRKKPYSVVLFDEIEKAHPDILNILLQILEDGRLTDSQKRLIPFDNTVIVMTSNAAAEEIQSIIKKQRESQSFMEEPEDSKITYNDSYAGAIEFLKSPIKQNFFADLHGQISKEFEKSFKNYKHRINELRAAQGLATEKTDSDSENKNLKELKSVVLERLSTLFLPEFLNRLDDVIIFHPLSPEELRKICDIMITQVSERLKKNNIELFVDEKVKNKLTREGYNPAFGARPLRRLVTKHIEDLISETLLNRAANSTIKGVEFCLDEEDNVVAKAAILS